VAFLFPDRRELAKAVKRLLDHGYPIDHGTDHGGTVAIYLDDPDGNGVELSYDRPRSEWFDADGQPVIQGRPLRPPRAARGPVVLPNPRSSQ
jgi:catechol 2,3-dioxygenase